MISAYVWRIWRTPGLIVADDVACDLARDREQVVVGDDTIHQAELQGLGRAS